MFCPKCGTQNPETGKFCRSCGTDWGTASDALAGKTGNKGFGMFEPIQSTVLTSRRGRPINWASVYGKIFMGLVFLVVVIFLGVTGKGGGWWFWMLIPAFAMLGSGMAHYVQLKKTEQQRGISSPPVQNTIAVPPQNAALPPTQTEYISPDSRYKTGDLVPLSVTDGTARHLEINKEGETMTMPKK